MIVAERGVQMELLLSVSGGMELDLRARGERVCERRVSWLNLTL